MYRMLWLLSLIAIVAVIIVGNLLLPTLPGTLPSHWNSDGVVDGWQSSTGYVWAMPLITLSIVVILGIMSARLSDVRVRPHIAMSAALFTAYMLAFHVLIGIRASSGQDLLLTEFMRLLAGLFIGLAFVIKDVPPNHIAGFRLPWTIHHPDVWRVTHVVGFWSMACGGLLCLLVTFIPMAMQAVFWLGIGSILLGTIIPSVFSYWYARNTRMHD